MVTKKKIFVVLPDEFMEHIMDDIGLELSSVGLGTSDYVVPRKKATEENVEKIRQKILKEIGKRLDISVIDWEI